MNDLVKQGSLEIESIAASTRETSRDSKRSNPIAKDKDQTNLTHAADQITSLSPEPSLSPMRKSRRPGRRRIDAAEPPFITIPLFEVAIR